MKWSTIESILKKKDAQSLRALVTSPALLTADSATTRKTAIRLYRLGHLKHCLKLLDAIERAKGSLPKALQWLKGDALLDLGDFENAIRVYDSILADRPIDIAFNNKAYAQWELGDHRAALKNYLRALRLNEHNEVAHRGAGEMLLKLGKPKGAVRHFAKALQRQPRYGEALAGLGLAHYRLRSWAKAYRFLREAAAISPEVAKRVRQPIHRIEEHFDLGGTSR